MKRIIMALVAGFILAVSVTAYAGIVDDQVDRNAAILMSKIAAPKFATVTDGSAPTAAAYLALTKRTLAVGDIIQKTGTAQYYSCTSTTGPAWKLIPVASIGSADGTATAPAYNFLSDTNTGMYRAASDTIGFSTGGTLRLSLSTTGLISTLPILGPGGLATAVAIGFSGDENTGFYSAGADQLNASTGGTLRLTLSTTLFTTTLPIVLPAGAVGAPAVYVSGSATSGLYSAGANNLNFTISGAQVLGLTGATVTIPTGVNLIITDAPTAGTEAANKDYVDGIQETVLAKSVAIECNTSTDQLLYTVPNAKTAVVTKVILRAPSVAQAANLAGGFGFGIGGTGWGTFIAQAGFDGATKYFIVGPGTGASVPALGAQNTVFYLNSTTEAGVACTATADVIGYTY